VGETAVGRAQPRARRRPRQPGRKHPIELLRAAWEAVRPAQPAVVDRKTSERVRRAHAGIGMLAVAAHDSCAMDGGGAVDVRRASSRSIERQRL
jgi:hypothetical protein